MRFMNAAIHFCLGSETWSDVSKVKGSGFSKAALAGATA
jgi:hypothetical protein